MSFTNRFGISVTRIWENLSIQQKVLFVAAPVMLLLAIGFRRLPREPSSDGDARNPSTIPPSCSAIVQQLETEGIEYEIPNERVRNGRQIGESPRVDDFGGRGFDRLRYRHRVGAVR